MRATWENINNAIGFKLNDLELFHIGSLVNYIKTEFLSNIGMETTQLATFFHRSNKVAKNIGKLFQEKKFVYTIIKA